MFNVGDKIIYPMHGAGVIQSVDEKMILGERKNYYSVTIIGNQMDRRQCILSPLVSADDSFSLTPCTPYLSWRSG